MIMLVKNNFLDPKLFFWKKKIRGGKFAVKIKIFFP